VGGPKVAGCHVIGTGNTGLPNLATPEEVATVTSAGDLDALRGTSEMTIGNAAAGSYECAFIRSFAATINMGKLQARHSGLCRPSRAIKSCWHYLRSRKSCDYRSHRCHWEKLKFGKAEMLRN